MIGCQVYGQLGGAAADMPRYGRAKFSEQCTNRRVPNQCDGGEPRDAFLMRTARQPVQQRAPDALSLGMVDDGDTHLGDRRVPLRPHKPSDAENVAGS